MGECISVSISVEKQYQINYDIHKIKSNNDQNNEKQQNLANNTHKGQNRSQNNNNAIHSIKEYYRQKLKRQIMGYVTDLPNSLFKEESAVFMSIIIKRLTKEITKFKQLLPCEHTNAIFVRCDDARMNSMNVLISGSTGTPYANGLYHFELFCNDNFPSAPPKMQLLTGKDKVRFNPNIYMNGHICLSLLGTWQSSNYQQSWNPASSSLAQIFLSIQSIIMNNDIYYNEPGLQKMKGTQKGQLFNEGYSKVVKIANIRHAMIQIIKKPPKGFEKVVNNHFFIKKDEILKQCQQWLSQKDKPFNNCGQNRTYQSAISNSYCQILLKEIQQLKSLLLKLTEQ